LKTEESHFVVGNWKLEISSRHTLGPHFEIYGFRFSNHEMRIFRFQFLFITTGWISCLADFRWRKERTQRTRRYTRTADGDDDVLAAVDHVGHCDPLCAGAREASGEVTEFGGERCEDHDSGITGDEEIGI